MRLIMMGTGPFAVPTFRSLLDSEHTVAALVTRPVPPARGRRKTPPNPMKDAADDLGVPVLAPASVNDDQAVEQLATLQADLMVVCDYGQILADRTLALTPLGGINLHASLLPEYRGAAPINWALLDGKRETGVSVIHMTPKLDSGPCLVRKATSIGPNEDAVQLETRLAQLGIDPVHAAIDMLAAWDRHSVLGTVQDRSLATKAPRLKKTDGLVDWSRTAEQLCSQVRALKPWPGTFTSWQRPQGDPLRLILDRVSIGENTVCCGPGTDTPTLPEAGPGQVVKADKQQLWVATVAGVLAIERLQPSGKRVMEIAEFLRGHHVQPGDRFA